MSKRASIPLGLLVLLAFFAPIMGGQLPLDTFGITESSDIFKSIFGGPEAPLLGHALLCLLAVLSFATLLLQRKIIQVPGNALTGLLVIFLVLILGSVGISSFKFTSMISAVEWMSYGLVFFAVVAATGRQRGPLLLLAAMAGGSAVLALLGILEYGANKATDPTWRIFSLWVNPNALGAMLLIGFFAGLTLTVVRSRTESLAAGAATLLIAFAMLLTQSKGVLLSLAVGLVPFTILLVLWDKGEQRKLHLMRPVAIVALLVLAFGAMQMQAKAQGVSVSRITTAQSTSVQSSDFRRNLWKTAATMAQDRPIGYGIGTFRYESGRPGITTQTQLAHNVYLQLAAEASPIELLLLLAIAGYWFFQVFRGARKLPAEQNLARAGVISAVVAVGAHSWVDSDLYYYGIGVCFFILMALGLLLASDAVAPENTPKPARLSAVLGSVFVGLGMLYFALVDVQKAMARGLIEGGMSHQDVSNAREPIEALKALAPSDGEVWYLAAQVAKTSQDRESALKQAAELTPSTKNLRSLARFEASLGLTAHAITALNMAVERDRNNLLALLQLAQLLAETGQTDQARKTYERLIAIEQTPYMTVRALPEIVPTETYEGRIELAKLLTPEPPKGAQVGAWRQVGVQLLRPAVDGLAAYREVTLPLVLRAKDSPNGYAGETVERAKHKLELGASTAEELAKLYTDSAEVAKMQEEAGKFRNALSTLP